MEGNLIWFMELVISLNKPHSAQDQVRNLLIGRESVQFLLREEETTVHGHLKDPPRALDELWLNTVESAL